MELVISRDSCPAPDTPADCRRRFREAGKAWAGDVNGDGVEELLIEPGTGGSGGDDMTLFQKRENRWVSILDAFPYDERIGILPLKRGGYHDLYLDTLHCFKWNGSQYFPYEVEDYGHLRVEFFDVSSPDDASIVWLSRHAGQEKFQLKPFWFSRYSVKKWGIWTELPDSQSGLLIVAQNRGGVWGVRGAKSFLILPRPAYRGCERLEFKGEWVVIYGAHRGYGYPTPVARYNPRTSIVELLGEGVTSPYWLQSI